MRTPSPLLLAASLALAGMHGTLAAQTPAAGAAAKPTPPTKEQIEDASFELRVLISAMGSDKIEAPVKDALFECLYQNNFAKISDGIAKVIAQNPEKIAKRNPDQVLGVMAGICGYRPKPAAAGATPAPTTPAKPATPPAKPGAQSGR